MNLVANSGIQYVTVPLEINLNDSFKMFFYEWFDEDEQLRKLEIAHNFSDDEKWVKKRDLALLGYLTDGKVGRFEEDDKFKAYQWDEVEDDLRDEGISPITDNEETNCFQMTLKRCRWEKFENRWLPFPFFTLSSSGKSEFAPTNWCRAKLIPDAADTSGNVKKYSLLLAFDTRTKYDDDGDEEDVIETPVLISNNDKEKDFALCNNEFLLVDFCSELRKCKWIDEYILNLYHNVKSIDGLKALKIKNPQMSYLAQFIYIIRYIQQLNILPTVTLYSDENVAFGDVDLLVDMGNSRTCAVLFDNSDFTKVELLGLQNFSNPLKNGTLNRQNTSFDMRLAFREADFGGKLPKNSIQFVYPSMVRLGAEANELIYKNKGEEKITTFSSPKRFLWDNKLQKEWGFVTLQGEESKPMRIEGISEQLNSDGSLNIGGSGGVRPRYSRKALMTFGMLEILAQAKMQINSYEFRHDRWGDEKKPRRINRIIITCPTAMSRKEQIALRQCAEEAAVILDRFYYQRARGKELNEKEARKNIQVIPSVKNLRKTEEDKEWVYDEATCAQFVYLFAEINKRYQNKYKECFDNYGKVRKDLGDYNQKSLTIGSVDIGAGTTDVMIAAYKHDDTEQCRLTPVPLFWESFYIAGDDLLKDLIQKLVIEGDNAAIQKQLKARGANNITELIHDFFGIDNARKYAPLRQIRSDFNLQVSVPVVSRFLELLNEEYNTEKRLLTFDDIFPINRPTDRVLEHFKSHFGFAVEDLQWHYNRDDISTIVQNVFDNPNGSLLGKISVLLANYGCDIVLLSGRPTSLKPLSDLFLKYSAVSPNRLITLNNYRIGTWYPFQDGKGYFTEAKSIVAIGAMIGDHAATRGHLEGFSLDLSELAENMLPTTDYFALSPDGDPFITPEINSATIELSLLPLQIWTRQLNSKSYPTRPFYMLDFDKDKIRERMIDKFDLDEDNEGQIDDAVKKELEGLGKKSPYKFTIVRENYLEDKEDLKIESVEDCNNDDLPLAYFSLQVQSMSEVENYWLDSGEFTGLNINHNN